MEWIDMNIEMEMEKKMKAKKNVELNAKKKQIKRWKNKICKLLNSYGKSEIEE